VPSVRVSRPSLGLAPHLQADPALRRRPPTATGRDQPPHQRHPRTAAAPPAPPSASTGVLVPLGGGGGANGGRRVRAWQRQPSRPPPASTTARVWAPPAQPNCPPGLAPAAGICETYVVAPGDSVVSIAQKFSVSQSECGTAAAAAPPHAPPPASAIWPGLSRRHCVNGSCSAAAAVAGNPRACMRGCGANRLWVGRPPAEAAPQRPPTAQFLAHIPITQLSGHPLLKLFIYNPT
jgi:hypothetical protein